MSLRKSDTSSPPLAPDAPAGAAAIAPRACAPWFFRTAGIESLTLNLPIPLLLLILIPICWLIEGREFNSFTLPGIDRYFLTVLMFVGYNIILSVSLQLINGFSGQFSLGHAGFMAVGAYLASYPAITFANRFADPAACFVFFLSLAVVFTIGGVGLLAIFVLIRKSRRWHPSMPMVLLIALVAWVLFDFAKGGPLEKPPLGYVWTHAVEDLRRLFLWIIQTGAAPAAKISNALPPWLARPACFLILIVGGGACAGVVGLVVGMPALRLRGDYLAIATLGLAEIIRILIQNSEPLGGALGLQNIPRYTDFTGNGLFWLYAAAIITIIVIWRLGYSAKGRAIMAVREDEIAAAAIGIDTTRQKVVAFMVGAFFAGVAGAMYGLHERSITPTTFNMTKSIEVVVMVTLGGLGSISGAILAAIVLTLLPEVLRGIGDYRMIIYSALLILMMLLRPQGLLGGRELWPRRLLRRRRLPVATEDRGS
jgi:ABC-type branched-subunit amino acid transport system permease subunit